MPKLRIEEAAARRQARIDRGEEVIVGVNKFQPKEATADRDPRHRQRRRCANRRSRGCTRSAPARDEAKCVAALKALGEAARNGTGNLLALVDRGDAGARHGGRDLLGAGRRLRPLPGDHPLDLRRLCRRMGGRCRARAHPHRHRRLRRGGGPPAAPDGREDGPGRPRPRRQGDRHRLRRSRLRRRYRPAVPDAGGGGARGDRERRACDRRVEPGGRPQDAGAAADRGAGQAGRLGRSGRGRRRHPRAGLRLPEEGGRRGDLRPRHQHPGGGGRDPGHPAPPRPASARPSPQAAPTRDPTAFGAPV